MHDTQQRWQAPPDAKPQRPLVENPRNGYGVAALVLGIVSFLMGFATIRWGASIGFPIGVASLVCGIAGWRRIARREADNRGLTTTALVLAAVGIAFGLYAIVTWISLAS